MRHPIPLILALVAVIGIGGYTLRKPPQTKQTLELERIARVALNGVPTNHERWRARNEVTARTKYTTYSSAEPGGSLAIVDVDDSGVLRRAISLTPMRLSSAKPNLLCEECTPPARRSTEAIYSPSAREDLIRIFKVLWPNSSFDTAIITCFSSQDAHGDTIFIDALRTYDGIPFRDQNCRLLVSCADGSLSTAFSDWESNIPPPFPADAMAEADALDTFLSNEVESAVRRLDRTLSDATLDQFEVTFKLHGPLYVDVGSSAPHFLKPGESRQGTDIPAYFCEVDLRPTSIPGWQIGLDVWLDPQTGELIGGDYSMVRVTGGTLRMEPDAIDGAAAQLSSDEN